MKKVELLSPAGNMECLYQAVNNGADAVYLGGKNFGARKYASNFDNDEMISAIKYCHLYGVKIYVTVNTMIFDNEMESVLKYVEFLHENNVDALIVQDLGLIRLIRKYFPNLEIHASTQCHNYNKEAVEAIKEMGVARVVLAREMSLSEINRIDVDIEKEVFVHGALCVCYSGCCLFSSMNGGRSGNRGACVGSCRLPYKFYKNNKEFAIDGDYPLSTKSLCTIEKIGELIESGITSFKIEGRMKSPEYVGYITRLYRNKIDEYYSSRNVKVDNSEITNIKKLYNRELTLGYLFDKYGKSLMNIKTSNHIGTHLGKIISIDNNKIKIRLDDDVSQEDGIRFSDGSGMVLNKLYNSKDMLVNSLSKGEILAIDNKIGLRKASMVRKTTDSKLLKELSRINPRKIAISMSLVAKVGDVLLLTISDGVNTVKETSKVVEKSLNSPISRERIIEQINKLGNTPFKCDEIKVEMDDNIFISIKELNEIRREAVLKLTNKREYYVPREFKKVSFEEENIAKKENIEDLKISILVRDEEQLKVAIEEELDSIYITDYSLYKKYENLPNVFYRTRRVENNYKDLKNKKILASDFGAVFKYSKDNYVVSDYYLNVANSSSISSLLEKNVERVTLSVETRLENIENLNVPMDKIEQIIYGRIELMITKYCPINMLVNKDDKKCDLCHKNDAYFFKDQYGNLYPIINERHLTHIMHYKNINLISDIKKYKELGINHFRIELFDEKKKDIEKILKEIRGTYE